METDLDQTGSTWLAQSPDDEKLEPSLESGRSLQDVDRLDPFLVDGHPMLLAHILADLRIIDGRSGLCGRAELIIRLQFHFLKLLDVLHVISDDGPKVRFLAVIQHACNQRGLDLRSLDLPFDSGTRYVFIKCSGEIRGMPGETPMMEPRLNRMPQAVTRDDSTTAYLW